MADFNQELRANCLRRTLKKGGNSAVNVVVTGVSESVRAPGILSANPVFKAPNFDDDLVNNVISDRPVPTMIRDKTIIHLLILDVKRTAIEEFMLMLYFWNRLERQHEEEQGTERFVGMCAGVALNTFNNTHIAEVVDAMKKYHEYDIRPLTVNLEWLQLTLAEELNADDKSKILLDKVLEDYSTDTAVIQGLTFILGGLIMILMGKQIHAQVSDAWFFSRYKALGSRSGYLSSIKILEEVNLVPDRELCSQYNITISGHFEVRKIVFTRLRDLSNQTTVMKNIVNVIIDYLAWTEMTHIDIILRYIIEKYPELLSIRCLASYQTAINTALLYIQSKPSEERRWIKILYPIEETKCLNTSKFTTLVGVARLIATQYATSYNNYNIGTDNMAKSLEGPIKAYLSLRIKNTGKEVQHSDHVIPFEHIANLELDEDETEDTHLRN